MSTSSGRNLASTPSRNATSEIYADISFVSSDHISILRTTTPQDWTPVRSRARVLICNPIFNCVISLSILLGWVLIVIEVDAKASDTELPMGWKVTDHGLLGLYTCELILRLYVYRWAFFAIGTNCVDFFVVVFDIILEILELSPFPTRYAPSSVRFLRAFRIFRLARAVKFLGQFRELYLMVSGFFYTFKAVFWAGVLLAFNILGWSIVSVEVLNPLNKQLSDDGRYENCERCPRFYESVWQASLTFMQQVVAGDEWATVTMDLIEAYPYTAILFLASLVTINLGIMNLALMVIVDRAQEARQNDVASRQLESQQAAEEFKEIMYKYCRSMDADSDGTISLAEILDARDKMADFSNLLDILGVDQEEIATLFEFVDEKSTGRIKYDVFVDQLHKMKTEDTHMMIVFLRFYVVDMRRKLVEEWQGLQEALADKSREDKLVERIVHSLRPFLGSAQSTDPEMSAGLDGIQTFDSRIGAGGAIEQKEQKKMMRDEVRAFEELTSASLSPHVGEQASIAESLDHVRKQLENLHGQVVDEALALHAQKMLTWTEALASALDQKAELFLNVGQALQQRSAGVTQSVSHGASRNLAESWQIPIEPPRQRFLLATAAKAARPPPDAASRRFPPYCCNESARAEEISHREDTAVS